MPALPTAAPPKQIVITTAAPTAGAHGRQQEARSVTTMYQNMVVRMGARTITTIMGVSSAPRQVVQRNVGTARQHVQIPHCVPRVITAQMERITWVMVHVSPASLALSPLLLPPRKSAVRQPFWREFQKKFKRYHIFIGTLICVAPTIGTNRQ